MATVGNRIKRHFYMTEDLAARSDAMSKSLGIPHSAFVNICVAEYLRQADALSVLGTMEGLVARLQALREEVAEREKPGN